GGTATTSWAAYIKPFPYGRLMGADVAGALIGGTYASLLGYFGGKTFEEQPWKGLIVAFAVAVGLAATIEFVRHRRERRKAGKEGEAAPGRPAAPSPSEDVPSSE